jgi:hypothetical protein
VPIGEGWEVPSGEIPWSDHHWFRVSPRGALVVVCLSEGPLWYSGHFIAGRMAPCIGDDCPLCAEGVGGQVRYVFAAAEVSTRRVGLLEVGRSNGLLIRSWIGRNAGFKGMVLELTKHSQARGSRTDVQFVDREEPPWYLALECPNVKRALLMTWKKGGFTLPKGMQE